jgi:hypothetical protein
MRQAMNGEEGLYRKNRLSQHAFDSQQAMQDTTQENPSNRARRANSDIRYRNNKRT